MKRNPTAIALCMVACGAALELFDLLPSRISICQPLLAARVDLATEAKDDALVNMMASRNVPPELVGEEQRAVFPSTYDWDDQARVLAAIQNATKEPGRSWQALVAHLDDGRYCITVKVNNDRNLSVGKVCNMIISGNLEAFYMRRLPAIMQMWKVGFARKSPASLTMLGPGREWLKDRHDKALYELQIELGNWAFHQLNDRALVNVRPKEKNLAIQRISSDIHNLEAQKEPIVATYDECFGYTSVYTDEGRRLVRNVLQRREKARPTGSSMRPASK
jgi:hypothetical protein